jgi:hypothetical protein
MKKVVLLGIIFYIMAVIVGCSDDSENIIINDSEKFSFNARIVEIQDGSALVEPIGVEHISLFSDRVSFGTAGLYDIGASVGDVVAVVFTGDVEDTDPPVIIATTWSLVNLATGYAAELDSVITVETTPTDTNNDEISLTEASLLEISADAVTAWQTSIP